MRERDGFSALRVFAALSGIMNIIAYMAWLPLAFYSIIFPAAVYFYLRRKPFWRLIIATILFYFGFAAFKTWLQFQLWSRTELGKILLSSPLDQSTPSIFSKLGFLTESSGGYFFYYALSRFWFSLVATVFVAALFYAFLKLLEKYQPRFFERHDPELGLLLGLLVGWPYFLLFLPLGFFLTVVLSFVMLVFFRKNRVTLGWPLLLGAALSLSFGNYLNKIIPIGLLKI